MRGDANGKGLFRKTTYSFADTISNAKSISFFIKKKKKKKQNKTAGIARLVHEPTRLLLWSLFDRPNYNFFFSSKNPK